MLVSMAQFIQNASRKNIVITSGGRSAFVYNGITLYLEFCIWKQPISPMKTSHWKRIITHKRELMVLNLTIFVIVYIQKKYEDDQSSLYYTDYKIAIQDVTNNVRFDVSIHFDEDITLSDYAG